MEYILLVLISLIVFSFIFSIKENFDIVEYKTHDYSTITNSLNNNVESNIESKLKDYVGSKQGPCNRWGSAPCISRPSVPTWKC